jgi:hypothetical protein
MGTLCIPSIGKVESPIMRTSYTQSKKATVSTKPLQTMWRGLLAAAAALLLALVGTQSTSAQSTLTVCADGCAHTTIQAAINAAAAGDTDPGGSGHVIWECDDQQKYHLTWRRCCNHCNCRKRRWF